MGHYFSAKIASNNDFLRLNHHSLPAIYNLYRAAHRNAIQTQGRLADADRDALAFLAADADAGIELHVITDERNTVEYVRAVTDQGGALDRVGNPAVLDHISFAGGKHEFAIGDVNLTAAEIDGIQTVLHRG